MPNGIDLILADHVDVNALFTQFANTPDGAIVGQILDKLKAHDDAERAALYPIAATVLGDIGQIEHSLTAHRATRAQIVLVSTLEGGALVDAVAVLRSLVDEHVAEEENDLLPALAGAATPQQIDELGARFLQAKQRGG